MRIARFCLVGTLTCSTVGAYACSPGQGSPISVRPRVGSSSDTGVSDIGGLEGPRSGPGAGRSAVERRVCRTSGWPSEWVAVAYESVSTECPRSSEADGTGIAATIVRLDAYPVGGRLDICADQVVPKDWASESPETVDPPPRCPGAAPSGAPTTKRIRRVR